MRASKRGLLKGFCVHGSSLKNGPFSIPPAFVLRQLATAQPIRRQSTKKQPI
jgi:hypothetical protein